MIAGAGLSDSGEGSSHMSVGEGATHPCLLIKDILEVIFNHILDKGRARKEVVKDVLNIRLVSKIWKDSVTPLYRPTGPLITFEEYDLMNKSEGILPFTAFMDMIKSSTMINSIKMIPVQKFEFCWTVFRDGGGLDMFRDFLLLCGPQLVSLKLDIRSSDAERIMKLDYLSEVEMMKLKTLKLSMSNCYPPQGNIREGQIKLVNLVELFLNASRTLEMLKLVYQGQDILLQQISTRIPRTVKRLELYTMFDGPIFNNLADAGLELEWFKLLSIPSSFGGRTLYKFLESQAATLKELQLQFWDCRPDQQEGIPVEFPRLHQLIHLELPNLIVDRDFTETFSKLQILDIRGLSSENSLLTLLSSVKCPPESLKVLHLPSWQSASLAPFVKRVATSFPSIAELHISPSPDFGNETTLEKVFKYFVNLESLSFCENEGMQITGWSEYEFSGVSESHWSRIIELQDFENVNLNNFRRQPSILNLTKLKKFVVGTDCQMSHWFSFTDFSAHFIFLEMENLREIRLPNSAVQFSPKYLDLLGNRLVLLDG